MVARVAMTAIARLHFEAEGSRGQKSHYLGGWKKTKMPGERGVSDYDKLDAKKRPGIPKIRREKEKGIKEEKWNTKGFFFWWGGARMTPFLIGENRRTKEGKKKEPKEKRIQSGKKSFPWTPQLVRNAKAQAGRGASSQRKDFSNH